VSQLWQALETVLMQRVCKGFSKDQRNAGWYVRVWNSAAGLIDVCDAGGVDCVIMDVDIFRCSLPFAAAQKATRDSEDFRLSQVDISAKSLT